MRSGPAQGLSRQDDQREGFLLVMARSTLAPMVMVVDVAVVSFLVVFTRECVGIFGEK
jgi:hypothetical protein